MTVFYAYAEVPADVRKVWEIDPASDSDADTAPWVRAAGSELWRVRGEDEGGLELTWPQLMENFGPLTDDPAMAGVGLDALPSGPGTAPAVVEELRAAADKITTPPNCGGEFSACVCDYADRLASLLRDVAQQAEQEPAWPVFQLALDIARRINRPEVSR